jgi:hypothetical protein
MNFHIFIFSLLCLFANACCAATVSKEAILVIKNVHKAAKMQDLTTLQLLMAPEFIWSFGGDASAEQAIQEWNKNPAYFRHLYAITGKPCAVMPDHSVECPKKAALSYRAGFKQMADGWRMIYFVDGD